MRYELDLASKAPTEVQFKLALPDQELTLSLPKSADVPVSAPRCVSGDLKQTGPRTWLKPAGCKVVRWSASIASIQSADFDASRPVSAWVGRHQLWLLTSSLPWLRVPGKDGLPVKINAQLPSGRVSLQATGPTDKGIPVYIPVGQPARRFGSGGFTIATYGEVPTGQAVDGLQRDLASTLARWWRDIPPHGAPRRDHFNFLWFGPSKDSKPGIFASAGSDALLIQFVPGPNAKSSEAKLQAAVFGVGAHEALHSLFESVPGFSGKSGKPWATWAAESLPTYFAYKAAHRYLKGTPLATFSSEIINARSDQGLLNAEAKADAGDEAAYEKLYGRGARFWWAVEKVLTVAPNGSGKLSALIQQTGGMEGMDWHNAENIASYLNHFSSGHAGPIVQCFLVDDNCTQANKPIP